MNASILLDVMSPASIVEESGIGLLLLPVVLAVIVLIIVFVVIKKRK